MLRGDATHHVVLLHDAATTGLVLDGKTTAGKPGGMNSRRSAQLAANAMMLPIR
jgi:hypothetical protein